MVLAAAALTLVLLGLWEGAWRAREIAPSVSNLEASWNVARDRVRPDSIVLAGTSKMQSAIDPRVLGEALGREAAVQLALIDRSPLPILEELARDGSFVGTVVMDVAPRIFFDAEGGREQAAEAILDAYRAYRVSPGERADARLGLLVESSLTFRRPVFSLRRLVDWRLVGRPLRLPFARVRLDRFRELEFDKIDLQARRRSQARVVATVGRPASAEELATFSSRLAAAAAAIRSRGGEVVLTLLPVSGRARQEEERRFPRAVYWDELVSATGLRAIHFEDFPELAGFECADGLHLDREAAVAFTPAFAGALARELR